jgi:hypothetical protein
MIIDERELKSVLSWCEDDVHAEDPPLFQRDPEARERVLPDTVREPRPGSRSTTVYVASIRRISWQDTAEGGL